MPLRGVFKGDRNVRVLLAEVTGFDLTGRRVLVDRTANGEPDSIPSTASSSQQGPSYSYFGHDEWRPLAPDIKAVEGALEVRRRILTAFEAAEAEPDPERRDAYLTFCVVGGGPTGVEPRVRSPRSHATRSTGTSAASTRERRASSWWREASGSCPSFRRVSPSAPGAPSNGWA